MSKTLTKPMHEALLNFARLDTFGAATHASIGALARRGLLSTKRPHGTFKTHELTLTGAVYALEAGGSISRRSASKLAQSEGFETDPLESPWSLCREDDSIYFDYALSEDGRLVCVHSALDCGSNNSTDDFICYVGLAEDPAAVLAAAEEIVTAAREWFAENHGKPGEDDGSARSFLRSLREALPKPQFYECGICGHYHNVRWDGDCRDDANRFTEDQLESKHGREGEGWAEVEMPAAGEPKHGKGFNF